MTINERLSNITREMSIIGQLGSNERPRQNGEGAIVDTYNEASNLLSASVQALQRSSSGQSTRSALKHIEQIADEIMRYAIRTPSPFEYYMTYSNRIERFSQLLTHITEVIDSGLPNFLETSTTCSSSLYSQSQLEIEERKALFETTAKKVAIVAKKLQEKITEYNELNTCASEQGLPPVKEHLYTIIELILNPDPKFNISTLNINGYQNFCADIAKELLLESFEREHVAEILRFYRLDHAVRLTYADLQAIIIGIVSNLTYRDIQAILKKTNGIAYKIIEQRLPNGVPSSLDEQSVLYILDILRTIDMGGAHCPSDRDYTDQLYGDLLFIESCKTFGYYNWKKSSFPDLPIINLRKFGRIEQFAREYVYALLRTDSHMFRQGILFPSYDENGTPTCFEGHLICRGTEIKAIASIPQPNISQCNNLVNISFRGTYQDEPLPKHQSKSQSSGYLGFWSKPVEYAFEDKNQAIIGHFISIANKVASPKDLKVEICGQGIGGCAAQRFAEALSNHFTIRKEDYRDPKISEVNLYCFDSPTIEEPIVERFIKDCLKLSDLNFTVRYFSSHIRKLTWYGGKHFLGFQGSESDSTPTNLNISWFNFFFHDNKNNLFDQLSEIYPQRTSLVERFYETPKPYGNNSPFFFERNKYETKKANPVYLDYYCTTNDDRKLTPKGKSVGVTNLPLVLTAGFKPD